MFRLPIKSGSLFRESQRAIALAIETTYTAAGTREGLPNIGLYCLSLSK
jgi:hypothetical protein